MTQDTRDRRDNELKKHFTNDGYFQYSPNKWVGWNKITKELLIVESKKNQYSELPQTLYYKNDGLRDHLKRYQGASYGDIDSSFISIDDEVLPIKDFINKACLTPYTRPFLYRALSIIPYEPIKMSPPLFYEKNGHLLFPVYQTILAENNLQKRLKENLKVGPIESTFIEEGRDLLRAHPKLWTSYILIPAMTVLNILKAEDFRFGLELIGPKDTGKTFAVQMAMHHWFGILPTLYWSNDSLKEGFREYMFKNYSNLPTYIDEAELSEIAKKQLKSGGSGARGKRDQSLNIYESNTTFIFSANTETKVRSIIEEEAIAKRVPVIYLNQNDVISEPDRINGKGYKMKLQTMNGGLIYEILSVHTINELRRKYLELNSIHTPIESIFEFGKWLFGLDGELTLGELISRNEIAEVYDVAMSLNQDATIEGMKVSDNVSVFAGQVSISAAFFKAYFIKREITTFKTGKAFAEYYSKPTGDFAKVIYTSVRIGQWVQKGIIIVKLVPSKVSLETINPIKEESLF